MADINKLIDKLTAAVEGDRDASDALMIIVADLTTTRAKNFELQWDLDRATSGSSKATARFMKEVDTALAELNSASEMTKDASRSVAGGLKSVRAARAEMKKVIEVYEEFRAQKAALKKNMSSVAGGALKALLGPATSVPPLKNLTKNLLG